MQPSIHEILDILAAHEIQPDDAEYLEADTPEIGEIDEGEQVYATSIAEIFRDEIESEGGDCKIARNNDPLRGDFRFQ